MNKKDDAEAADAATRPIRQIVQGNDLTTQEEPVVVHLREESLIAEKQWVKAGEVVIRKHVETLPQTVPVDLEYDEITYERLPVNQLFDGEERPTQRQEGDVTIIPVVEEQLVVLKRYFVREEIRITKRRNVHHEEISDTVRREHVSIETTGNLETAQDQS